VLIAVDLVALRTPRPIELLAWFLAGGLLTTIAEGLAIVFLLDGTPLASASHRAGGWGNLIGGIAALLAAAALKARRVRRADRPESRHDEATRVPWVERAVANGGRYAFGAGVVLNLFPGVFPLLALRDIAALSYGDEVKVLLVVGLYLCTFALVEIPLVGLLLAPELVEPRVQRLNRWLDRNGMRVAIDALALVGFLLVARGVVQLAAV
jgi:Sap-like sulfolipid-1-addressing protein